MTFEVWRDGERKFYTEDRRCIPSEKMQADLRRAGYKIKVKDGTGNGNGKKKSQHL